MIWKSFKDEDDENYLVAKFQKGTNQYICRICKIPIVDGFSLNIFHIDDAGSVIGDLLQTDENTKHLIKEAETFLETL